ncbi:hypothetical protein RUM43_011401 [Polyplax serrata]|uniref:Tubulin polyglutamylase TTLL2 n=1 Tax=Polyplax serrata TaxID=468196 RepID=A0AAN8NY73_POLSC
MSVEEGPFVFRVNENGTGPNLLIQVCMERGWREYTESTPIKDGWNLWWKTSAFSVSQHKHLKAWQFTNHIPKGASICRKDNLARNLKCMRKVYGGIYDISPHGYNLPLEYTKLVADCSRRDDEGNECQKVWICKPVGQSQGRGIFLFKSLSDLCYDSNAVVQRYIKNPLLIGGYKFDLRLYVCVPSYHPLTIYLYREGLVRFSTDKFSMADLNNPFCHLTNSSLNKLGPGYAEQKDRIGAGCKWSFRQLRQYFQQIGIRDWLLWQKISALVTLTVLSQSTSIPQTINCFEFYGFDVLIDEKLKPWLLEVNLSPALGNDCDVDPVVKKPLLHDLFDLLGLPVCYTGLSLYTIFSPSENRTPNSETEGTNDNENRQICLFKSRQKSSLSGQVSRCPSGAKATASSAILVATAASKWRRKRKSSYLFGPPQRLSIDSEKKKPIKEYTKSTLVSSIGTITSSDTGKGKEEGKYDERKSDAVITVDLKSEKKNLRTVKRLKEKDKNDKIKVGSNSSDIIKAGKSGKLDCHTMIKTATCSDNSKVVIKIESIIGEGKIKKKKKVDSASDRKQIKSRPLPFTNLGVVKDKQKTGSSKYNDTKTIVLPFDKSNSASKGFRGRTRPQSAMLWSNGLDWRTPVHREGDWGRIYPISNLNSKFNQTFEEDAHGNKFSVGDKQIRLVVHHITNFIKVAKHIYYKELNATEEELNSRLINNLGMTGDVWLPSK